MVSPRLSPKSRKNIVQYATRGRQNGLGFEVLGQNFGKCWNKKLNLHARVARGLPKTTTFAVISRKPVNMVRRFVDFLGTASSETTTFEAQFGKGRSTVRCFFDFWRTASSEMSTFETAFSSLWLNVSFFSSLPRPLAR